MYCEQIQEDQYRKEGAYHRSFSKIPFLPFRLRYNLALALLPNLGGLNCLDYGGGDGAMASLMADRGANVTIFDSSTYALKLAANHDPRLQTTQGRTKLPFNSGTFHVVTMLECLEHIPDEEESIALEEISRVLIAGGVLVLSVPSIHLKLSAKHYRHYEISDLKNKISQSGLVVNRDIRLRQPTFPDLYPPIFRKGVYGTAYLADYLMYRVFRKSLFNTDPDKAESYFILAQK